MKWKGQWFTPIQWIYSRPYLKDGALEKFTRISINFAQYSTVLIYHSVPFILGVDYIISIITYICHINVINIYL